MRRVTDNLAALPLLALALVPVTAANAQPASGAPGATRVADAGSAQRNDLSLSVTARYDSNVPRIDDPALLARRGYVKEDIRIGPSAQLYVTRAIGRHRVGLRSSLGYDFYIRNTRLNSERISVEPFVSLDLPVCDLTVEGQAARSQSELGDLVFVGLDPTIGLDNIETRKRINGRVVCGDANGLRPTFEVEHSTGSNDNPLRQIADYSVTRIQPGVGYASPGLGEISVYAVKQDTDLPNQIVPGGRAGGYSLRGYGVSYRRAIGTRLNFNGSVSRVQITPFGGATPSRSGLNGNIALTLVATPRLQLTGFASRNFTSTLTSSAAFELSEGYGLNATYAASDRLRLRAGGQVSPRRFFYAVVPTGPFIAKQTQSDMFVGATYNLNRRMRLTLDGGYQRRDADLNLFDYDGYFAAVGVSFSL